MQPLSKRSPIRWLAVLILAGIGVGLWLAASLAVARPQDPPPADDEGGIRPGEMLVISIDGLMGPGLESRLVRQVDQTGELWLPVLDDQPVMARGLTPGQLQVEIKRQLARKSVRTEIVAVARSGRGEDQQLVVPQVGVIETGRR